VSYEYHLTPMVRATHAGGVVYRLSSGRRRYLLVASTGALAEWVLPKGHVERGETIEEAARREVREEAGVLATALLRLRVVSFRRAGESVRVRFLLMRASGRAAATERRRVRWASYREARRLLAFADAREVLDEAESKFREGRTT
jgi:8-oxo-dGTP pyrophosphatase MutT (NUDIX family)